MPAADQKRELDLRLQKRNMEATQAYSEVASLRVTIDMLQQRIDRKLVEITQ